jgi:tetratricopeptide (TPR) repeat protein
VTGRQWTVTELAYAAWLKAAREALGASAAVVRNMQDHLSPADKSVLNVRWATPYSEKDWRSSYFKQWEEGRKDTPFPGIPTEVPVLAALIATVTEAVKQVPAGTEAVGSTFAAVVDALATERQRVTTDRTEQRISEEKKEKTRAILEVAAAPARELDALELRLGSSVFHDELPPYVPRTADSDLVTQLVAQPVGLTVVVGPPKSGKSRSVLQQLQQHLPNATVWWINPAAGVLPNLVDKIRSTPSALKPEVVVLDDAHLNGVNPLDGLTPGRLTTIATHARLIVIIHEKELASWVRQTSDRTSRSDNMLSTIGATRELVNLLNPNQVIYRSVLDDTELNFATAVYEQSHNPLDRLDLTRMAEVFATVDYLTKKANEALTAGGLHAAIVNAAIDASIAFESGIDSHWLEKLVRVHYSIEEPNKIWRPELFNAALDWVTTGIATRSPHAILTRTINDEYRLLDVLIPTLRNPNRDLTHLANIQLTDAELMSLGYWSYANGDKDAARRWWTQSAEHGHPGAMFNLGALANEDGDREDARTWYQKAATLGDPGAMFNLGILAKEDGDREDARTWYQKAATLGDPAAMFNLGVLANEDGDREDARPWYQKAATLNHPDAMFNLGVLEDEDGNHKDSVT